MNKQISWSLSDEVAPYFDIPYIATLCYLVDEKRATGKKYNDLKERLMAALVRYQALAPSEEIYNRAHEFAKYY